MRGAGAARIIPLSVLLVLASCTVNYDQITDQQIRSTIQDGDQQLSTWGSALSNYQQISYNAKEYGKILGDLEALKTTLYNSPEFETKNLVPIVDSQIVLWTNIQTLQSKSGFHDSDYLKAQLDIFNYNMGLLSLYENTLKGGASTGSAGASVSKAKAAGPAAPQKP